jgi:hypothetical protein
VKLIKRLSGRDAALVEVMKTPYNVSVGILKEGHHLGDVDILNWLLNQLYGDCYHMSKSRLRFSNVCL